MRLTHWLSALALFGPLIICAPQAGLVPDEVWDDFALALYPLLADVEPKFTSESSPVVLIEVDDETVEALGWPIERKHYRTLLEKLTLHGRPWILSLLHFQDLENPGGAVRDDDELLSEGIANYGRYIGSGVVFRTDADDLSEAQERILAPFLLSKAGPVGSLPYLPLYFRESALFVGAEKAAGFGAFFAKQSRVFCADLFVDSVPRGELVVPSAMFWMVAWYSEREILLDNGIRWRAGSADPAAPALAVAREHCLLDTSRSSSAYLKSRNIEALSMIDLLDGESSFDLRGKAVILAPSETALHLGPGTGTKEDVLAREHHLLARFLDGILVGQTARRSPEEATLGGAIGPAAVSLISGIALLALGALGLAVLNALIVLGLIAVSMTAIANEIYFVPIDVLASGAISAGLWLLVYFAAEFAKFRKFSIFRDDLRRSLSQCISVEELHKVVERICIDKGGAKSLAFDEGDTLTRQALQIRRLVENPGGTSLPPEEVTMKVALPQWDVALSRSKPRLAPVFVKAQFAGIMLLRRGQSTIGTLRFAFAGPSKRFVNRLCEALAAELSVHWHRIELVMTQAATDLQKLKLKQDLELGQTVQRLFLPEAMGGKHGVFDFKIVFQPYGPMSGDWVQVYRPPTERPTEPLVIAVGDVVGKGPAASLNTAIIASIWNLHARRWREGSVNVEALLDEWNRVIFEMFKGKQNSTLSLVVLGVHQTKLLRCGSPPWIVLKDQGAKRLRIKAHNPLGMLATSQYALDSVDLDDDDVLITFSDGAMDSGEAFSRFCDGLSGVARSLVPGVFGDIADLAKQESSRAALQDDFTLLMIRIG